MTNPLYSLLSSFDWLAWGVALIIGLPLLVVVLGELAHGLQRWGLGHWRKVLDATRHSCLFLLFLMVLLHQVVGLPSDHLAVKMVDTAFWIAVLNLAMILFNTVVFETRASEWHARAPKLVTDLGRIVLVAVGAAFVINHVWGVDLNGLLAALGVGSIVIGLAMQDTLSNLFGGVMLVTVRQFNIDDWIKVGEVDGQVRSISWRAVTVVTSNGDIVDIPNSQIYSQQLRIYGGDTGRLRISVEMRFKASDAPEVVKDILLEAAAATKGVLADPAPEVRIKSFDDAILTYEVLFWTDSYRARNVAKSEFLSNLWYVVGRKGLCLPGMEVPAGSSGLLDGAASIEATIAARLFTLGTFQRPMEALVPLAAGARIERYRRGEALMVAGTKGDAAFVVVSGSAQAICGSTDAASPSYVFAAGDLILFKSFLRGGLSPCMVRVHSDLDVIRIPIATLVTVLSRDVHLAQQVERLLSLREESGQNGISSLVASQVGNGSNDTDRVQILRNLFRN